MVRVVFSCFIFFFKQKTAYELRISDWSSDVCSSDLDQRTARERLTQAERDAQFTTIMKTGSGRIAELQEELRLIGATDAARVRALATIKATREAAANSWSGGQAQDYIDQQVRIAAMALQRQLRTDAFNDSLRYQADLLDAMAIH